MTYEEMKEAQRVVAEALKGAPGCQNAEAADFAPGEKPEVFVTINEEDFFLTVELM